MKGSATGYRHSGRFVRPFARVLRRHASMPAKVLDALDAVDADDWIPYSVSARFCERAIARTQDEDLGLHAAEAILPGDFDVVEFAARSCATIGEAIETVNRYIVLLREGANFHLERSGDHCIWNLSMTIRLPRVINDWTVAVYVVLGRALAGRPMSPTEVHVTHAVPHDLREYQRILGAPVRFSQDENRLLFPSDTLALPIKEADARLNAVMRRYAGDLLERRPSSERFSDRVRGAVAETLRGGRPGTRAVAERLHISERTLRRRLHEEGTTFKAILDGVRRELAIQYLGQPDLGIAEIAFMLGFSQTPAFSRAFKRWTGVAPIEQRKQRRLRPAS